MTDVRLYKGLPENLRPAAAQLYWQAFGGKLGPVMGPQPLAIDFLARAISAEHIIVALDASGGLLGIAGFKTPHGSLAGGTSDDFDAAYGRFGSCWRQWLLRLLSKEIDNDRFLIDGICVQQACRGQGIGQQLLAALINEARARGYDYVRLDVIDTNWRARALYERSGFAAVKTDRIGWLRYIFGFTSSTTMVKPLGTKS